MKIRVVYFATFAWWNIYMKYIWMMIALLHAFGIINCKGFESKWVKQVNGFNWRGRYVFVGITTWVCVLWYYLVALLPACSCDVTVVFLRDNAGQLRWGRSTRTVPGEWSTGAEISGDRGVGYAYDDTFLSNGCPVIINDIHMGWLDERYGQAWWCAQNRWWIHGMGIMLYSHVATKVQIWSE